MARLRLIPVLSLLVTSIAAAQSATDTARIEAVVVTATRTPLAIGDLPASVTVLQGADLRSRGVTRVVDALLEVPGMAVARSGSFQGVTSVFTRGGQSNYTKILIDGVPMNQAGGFFDWSSLTTDNVERIEVVRGPSSVVWGSDAVTGVVNIITRSGRGGPRLMASARAGTYGTVDGEAQVSHSSTGATYSLGIAHHRSNGIYKFNNGNGSSVFSGRADAAMNEKTDGSFTVRYTDGSARYPTDGTGAAVDSNSMGFSSQLALSGRLRRKLTSAVSVQGLVTVSSHDGGTDNAPETGGSDFAQSLDHVMRRAAELRAITALGTGAVLTVGGQLEEQKQRSHSQSSFFGFADANTFTANRQNRAAFTELVHTGQISTLSAGARLDDNEHFGTFGTFRVGGQLKVADAASLRASVGSAFREPSFFETFNTAFTTGNPNLEPERTSSWEAGVIVERVVRLQATYFDQRFIDLIDYDGSAAPGSPNYQNIARANSRGVEVELNHPEVNGFRFDLSVTRLETKVVERGFSTAPTASLVEGQPLLRRPRLSGSARLGYRGIERLSLDGVVTYVGKRDDRRFHNFPTPTEAVTLGDYALVDLSGNYSLRMPPGRPDVSLTLRASNILDRHYESVAGYRTPGRMVLAGVRLSY
jgi:vitamin B12 transporter